MALKYYLSNTEIDSGFITFGDTFTKVLSLETETANTISITIQAASSVTNFGYADSLDSIGYNGTSTGTFTVKVNVTTAISGVNYAISLSRVGAGGTAEATSSTTATQSGAGVNTFTLTNPALGTWSSSDRLRVNYIFTNTLKKATTIAIGTGTDDESVSTPFTPIYNRSFGFFMD